MAKFTFLALALFVSSSLAQSVAVEPERLRDLTVLKQLKADVDAIPRGAVPKVGLSDGPLVFRLSTLQAVALRATKTAIQFDGRILDGILASPQEFPWQVAFLNASEGTLFCAGTHIGKGWIVTAAHCFKDDQGQIRKKNVAVLLGTNSLVSGGYRTSPLREPILHESYSIRTKANDIALVQVGVLPNLPAAQIFVGALEGSLVTPPSILTVSGWGRVKEGGAISVDLLKVDIPVSDRVTCKASYPDHDSETQICAGMKDRDSCQGDSGGPLVGRSGAAPILVGVVSHGFGCGRAGFPGVYTRAAAYRDWIRRHTGV